MWEKVILVEKNRLSLYLILVCLTFLFIGCEAEKPKDPSAVLKGKVDDKIIELSIKSHLDESLNKQEEFPSTIEVASEKYEIEYYIQNTLEKKIQSILRRHDPHHAAVAVIDNKTGGVLAAVGYESSKKKFARKIAFTNTHPAASIVKVITAAEIIEAGKVNYGSTFYFNGKSTTMYKDQLEDKRNKWSAKTTLATAFSYSNNVVFAKAALMYSSAKKIKKMAEKFGFSESLMRFVSLGKSYLFDAKTSYELAELATGFNKRSHVSPIHAASIATTVARGGEMISPQVVKRIKKSDQIIWDAEEREPQHAISFGTARQLKTMMKKVVRSGTARKMFRRFPSKVLEKLEIAGKTGSITGGVPYGKRDWFVSYVKKKKSANPGISIAVMLVHGKDWKVRSTLIAKKVMEYYFRNVK